MFICNGTNSFNHTSVKFAPHESVDTNLKFIVSLSESVRLKEKSESIDTKLRLWFKKEELKSLQKQITKALELYEDVKVMSKILQKKI
jgi:hypothetical protein